MPFTIPFSSLYNHSIFWALQGIARLWTSLERSLGASTGSLPPASPQTCAASSFQNASSQMGKHKTTDLWWKCPRCDLPRGFDGASIRPACVSHTTMLLIRLVVRMLPNFCQHAQQQFSPQKASASSPNECPEACTSSSATRGGGR